MSDEQMPLPECFGQALAVLTGKEGSGTLLDMARDVCDWMGWDMKEKSGGKGLCGLAAALQMELPLPFDWGGGKGKVRGRDDEDDEAPNPRPRSRPRGDVDPIIKDEANSATSPSFGDGTKALPKAQPKAQSRSRMPPRMTKPTTAGDQPRRTTFGRGSAAERDGADDNDEDEDEGKKELDRRMSARLGWGRQVKPRMVIGPGYPGTTWYDTRGLRGTDAITPD